MWQLSMHGSTDHLDPEVAAEAEETLRQKVAAVFGGLVEDGHQGVAGVFHHSHGAPVDLATAPPEADPTPDAGASSSTSTDAGAETSAAPSSDTEERTGEVASGQAPDVVMPDGEIANPTQPEVATPPPAE